MILSPTRLDALLQVVEEHMPEEGRALRAHLQAAASHAARLTEALRGFRDSFTFTEDGAWLRVLGSNGEGFTLWPNLRTAPELRHLLAVLEEHNPAEAMLQEVADLRVKAAAAEVLRARLDWIRAHPTLLTSLVMGLEPLDVHGHEPLPVRAEGCVACAWWGPMVGRPVQQERGVAWLAPSEAERELAKERESSASARIAMAEKLKAFLAIDRWEAGELVQKVLLAAHDYGLPGVEQALHALTGLAVILKLAPGEAAADEMLLREFLPPCATACPSSQGKPCTCLEGSVLAAGMRLANRAAQAERLAVELGEAGQALERLKAENARVQGMLREATDLAVAIGIALVGGTNVDLSHLVETARKIKLERDTFQMERDAHQQELEGLSSASTTLPAPLSRPASIIERAHRGVADLMERVARRLLATHQEPDLARDLARAAQALRLRHLPLLGTFASQEKPGA